jgi:hypothetical protein
MNLNWIIVKLAVISKLKFSLRMNFRRNEYYE